MISITNLFPPATNSMEYSMLEDISETLEGEYLLVQKLRRLIYTYPLTYLSLKTFNVSICRFLSLLRSVNRVQKGAHGFIEISPKCDEFFFPLFISGKRQSDRPAEEMREGIAAYCI